jgi:hypothetical protein
LSRVQKVSISLLVAALLVLALDIASSLSLWWFAGATFWLLLVLSGVTLSFDFIVRRLKLGAGRKILVALVLIGVVLLFFAPAIQIFPSSTGSASYCNPSGCSSITEIESITHEYLWCTGWEYTYSSPPAASFLFQFSAGCLSLH